MIPLVIHLLNRRQQKRLRFPAVRFVLISQRRVARTYNLRNWLLLAVRTLAIIFLVLLMAHPLWETGVGLSARGAPLSTAIIVDNSLSMQVRDDGAPFKEAKQAAALILEALEDSDQAALIATNPAGRGEPRFKDPREAALKDLEPLAVTAGSADLTGALRTGYGLLRHAGGQKAIWVVTDLGLPGWDRLSLPAVGEYDPTVPVKIVTVGSSETSPSATIKSLEPRTSHVAPGLDLGIAAKLVNFTATAIPDVAARLTLDDKVRDEKQLTLPADSELTVDFRFKLDRPGSHTGYVSLHGDGFAGNRRHHFTLHTRDRLNILLVDGDPQRALVASETFFLSRALNPTGDVASSVLLPQVILPGAVGQVNPEGYQVMVLANVATLPPALVARLAAFVERGGGLLLSLGDRVIAEDYNRTLWRNASPLLPGPLGATAAGAPGPERHRGRGGSHSIPPWSPSVTSACWTRYGRPGYRPIFEVTPTGGRTLMRLSNGAPLLVEKKLGKGSILLLTSTADSAWNNLPLKTGYVPLVQSLVTHIAGGDTGSMDVGITAGTAKRWSAAAAHAGKRVRVVDPNLTEREVTLAPVNGKASGTFDGNHFAGVYRVVSAGGDLKLPALYAVNPPPEESRLERMTADELQRKLGPVDHEVLSAGALAGGEPGPISRWPWWWY